jgi:hypothetical protein
MSDNPFFKQQEQKNSHHRPDKSQMHDKCMNVLNQIKKYSEDTYNSLFRTFASTYDRPNVQKKKILGFYGTLVESLKKLKASAGEALVSQTPPDHSLDPMALIQQKAATASTPPSKKAAAPKAAKKMPEKAEKKTEKKVEKKVAKKTETKADSAKKVAKKVVKKAAASSASSKTVTKKVSKQTATKAGKKVSKKK